ncbi:hypothetical protein [Streptomyces sp. NPDC048611]|uniref:hypothetical protein n=1 Tax=Streptomyces sp. NPDC048611 TaxID=3155635 RepID=UPI003447391D
MIDPQNRLRLAHQARRAKERLLDDIRHALMDVGVIEEGDPYGHADLADVIRQLDSELKREPAAAQDAPGLEAQLGEAETQASGWEEKCFEMGEKRSEALAAIDRVQKASDAPTGAVPGDLADWGSFLRGYEQGVRAAKAALRSPTEPTRYPPAEGHAGGDPLIPDFTSPIAGHVEVRRPCPYCGDRQMIPRTQFVEHIARLHPDERAADV